MSMSHREEVARRLQTIAKTINAQLPAGVGFALLVFADHGPNEHYCEYVSNCDREKIIPAMETWIDYSKRKKR